MSGWYDDDDWDYGRDVELEREADAERELAITQALEDHERNLDGRGPGR